MLPGLVLILAMPDDPFVTAFRQATADTVECWQPADLAEIGWSVTLAGGATVRLIDRASGRTWESSELGGIWFQALPVFNAIESLEERDRQYVIAEVRSSLAAIWRYAACPIVGQPTREGIDEPLGPGPEARIALRRLGLPSATMLLGPETIRTTVSETEVRLSPLGNAASRWLDSGQQNPESEWLLATAIASDDRSARVIAIVGTSIRVFTLAESGTLAEERTIESDEAIADRLRVATGLDLALAFYVRQDDEWRITRLSCQLPWWLAGAPGVTDWITSWLVTRFSTNRIATAGSGHAR